MNIKSQFTRGILLLKTKENEIIPQKAIVEIQPGSVPNTIKCRFHRQISRVPEYQIYVQYSNDIDRFLYSHLRQVRSNESRLYLTNRVPLPETHKNPKHSKLVTPVEEPPANDEVVPIEDEDSSSDSEEILDQLVTTTNLDYTDKVFKGHKYVINVNEKPSSVPMRGKRCKGSQLLRFGPLKGWLAPIDMMLLNEYTSKMQNSHIYMYS